MSRIEIRPLPIKKWHGKEGKEAFSQPIVLEVLYDTNTGRYATGLNEEETLRLEKETGLDLSDKFDANKPHPYWSTKSAQIKLPNHTLILDTSNNIDYIKVANIKASRFVANSEKEWKEGLFPDATHVIFDEEDEIKDKATKVQIRNKARSFIMNMSNDEKADIAQLISQKPLHGRSANFIDVEIDEIIEERPTEFIRFAEMDKAEVNVRASVLKALARNILTKEGSQILYMGSTIAMDYEEAVSWFKDKNNSKMKVAILEKLNN